MALRARSASGLLDALGLGYDLPVGQAVLETFVKAIELLAEQRSCQAGLIGLGREISRKFYFNLAPPPDSLEGITMGPKFVSLADFILRPVSEPLALWAVETLPLLFVPIAETQLHTRGPL